MKALNVESIVSEKVTVRMALNNKCTKYCMELILKRGSVKLQVYGKKPSQAITFKCLIFFLRKAKPFVNEANYLSKIFL